MESNDQEDIIDEIVEEKDDDGNDTTDWKSLALKNQGIAKRYQTKLEKQKLAAVEAKGKAEIDKAQKETEILAKKEGLDRLDKAILRTEKITSDEEVKLVEDIMKESGKTLEQVLESKYFQSELKEIREAQQSKDAVPIGTKRSGQSSRDSEDYWIAKGELPPADQVELRRKVVNARIAQEKSKTQFTDNPIV